ncbi:MAG: NAD(P)H-dependent oxidoreductase [Chitinophagaceae bacterium]
MRVAIIFNHPYEGSYCNAILKAVTAGLQTAHHEVDLLHLDNDGFNPVMTGSDLKAFKDRKPVDKQALAYNERLEKADHLVMIFPIWWELMPAMTKGFIDKVIFPGIAYDYRPNGFMKKRWEKLKSVTVITTMNTANLVYRFIFGNAIRKSILSGTFWKMGYKNRKWINLSMVKMVSDKKRKKWLANLEHRFETLQ